MHTLQIILGPVLTMSGRADLRRRNGCALGSGAKLQLSGSLVTLTTMHSLGEIWDFDELNKPSLLSCLSA